LPLGDGLLVEAALSTAGESAMEPAVEEVELEAEPRVDPLGLLVLATLFDGLFALLVVGVPASATFTGLSLAALVLATIAGDEVADSVRLESGGAGRGAVPEVPTA